MCWDSCFTALLSCLPPPAFLSRLMRSLGRGCPSVLCWHWWQLSLENPFCYPTMKELMLSVLSMSQTWQSIVFRLSFYQKTSKSRWPGAGNPAEWFPLQNSTENSSMNLPFCSSWLGILENVHKTKDRSLYLCSCRLIGRSAASWAGKKKIPPLCKHSVFWSSESWQNSSLKERKKHVFLCEQASVKWVQQKYKEVTYAQERI